ncbi:hypothetical protein ANAPC1_01338 [Anaplasma phagocytophilum]|uniref:Uncharacterized protein n=1 Tax=Anaplasma phagocytophilum TaxID=948 RepID=A0AA45UUG3_ANAPH|nr:hypothetical protein ANAPC1_01338 [Anaplasma phagocytophilum]
MEALSLVQEEEGTGMYLINAPEKAVVRFFKIEKKAAEEPQTVDPGVVESATGSGVDTQEEQEIDHEAPEIEVGKTEAGVQQEEISVQEEHEIAVLERTEVHVEEETAVLPKEDLEHSAVAQLPEAGVQQEEISVQEEHEIAVLERTEVHVEQELEDTPTALPLKDPEDEDVLNYLLARK